uniref:C-type lectin domain-containing protein n=1 Tax=Anser brachyrhynchus TaxID=132585 RepID=A0A8B9I8D2_9AVES
MLPVEGPGCLGTAAAAWEQFTAGLPIRLGGDPKLGCPGGSCGSLTAQQAARGAGAAPGLGKQGCTAGASGHTAASTSHHVLPCPATSLCPTAPADPGCAPVPVPIPMGLGAALVPGQQSRWGRAAFCRRFGSRTHLASVHSEEELQAVVDLLFSSRSSDASEEELDEEVWIGLHRPLRSRSWQWSDGTAVAYNSWHRAALSRRRACAALQDATGEPGTGTRAHTCTHIHIWACSVNT